MSGRAQPLNGADSEPLSQYDRSCDECLRTIYGEELHQSTFYTRMLCEDCLVTDRELPATLAGRALLVWVGLQGVGDADTVAALIRAAEKEAAR